MSNLEFEKQVVELEGKIAELRHVSGTESLNIAEEISRMQGKAEKLLKQTYSKLTPSQVMQVARHPNRPHFKDYVGRIIEDFTPLAGDRNFAEDNALIGGIGRFQGQSCVIMGQERGHDTESRIFHNFGMTRPEGYRKAQRLMDMAEQFSMPIITLVDTAGAYPGVGAEERGQAEAIAKSIEKCIRVRSPIISIVIGEGGSGGAIAIATADEIAMLEHSIYSVISPEGCASILWRSAEYAKDAAAALKITSQDMMDNGLIDQIIKEPLGGAHRNHDMMIANVETFIASALKRLQSKDLNKLLSERRAKFLAMGRNV